MFDAEDEEWLRRVLEGCFDDKSYKDADENSLRGFRILVSKLVKNIERNLKEARLLWEANPESKVLKEKFYSLEKALFYLRRFCDGRRKRKG